MYYVFIYYLDFVDKTNKFISLRTIFIKNIKLYSGTFLFKIIISFFIIFKNLIYYNIKILLFFLNLI